MDTYKRELRKAPKNLVNRKGEILFGCYNSPVENANLINQQSPYFLPLNNTLKNIQLREWQAFQIKHPDYFIMIALYNAKKMSLVQFILFDIKNNKKIRYEKKVAPWQIKVPNTLYNSTASYKSNKYEIIVNHDLDSSKLDLKATILGFNKQAEISANLRAEHDTNKFTPMVVSMPFNKRRGMYSHKCLMPIEGELMVGDKTIIFNKKNCSLILDDHKGYYPFPTRYDWVTALGFTPRGIRIGFNFTDNQVIRKDIYNENGLWLDGQLFTLPPIKISRPDGVEGNWIIKDEYGMVNLLFKPVINTSVNINLLVFKSAYEGPYGFYSGEIITSDGNKINIDNLFGMGEQFYLRI